MGSCRQRHHSMWEPRLPAYYQLKQGHTYRLKQTHIPGYQARVSHPS